MCTVDLRGRRLLFTGPSQHFGDATPQLYTNGPPPNQVRGRLFSLRARRIDAQEAGGSDVVVELELVGMRTQTNRIDFVDPLVIDPCIDQILREDSASLQVLVVGLECVEHG